MDRDGRSFTCKIVNSRIFKKAVDVYETFKTVVDKVGSVVKPVVETVVKAYNDFNKFIDETPTGVKIVAGAVGGILAAASGVSPIAVGVTLLSSAVSGVAISAAMYGLESISTGEFNKTDLINSMLDGALDMFYICGVIMGSKAVVDVVIRNAGRIQDALLLNKEEGLSFSEKMKNFLKDETGGEFRFGKTSYGKSSGSPVYQGGSKFIHGNSKTSTKPQHGYEIYNKKTGDVVKTGISGQPLNKNGTSPRANIQVNKLNKLTGEDIYDARIVIKDMPDRVSALEWEKENALKLWEEANSMAIHKRPRPWED